MTNKIARLGDFFCGQTTNLSPHAPTAVIPAQALFCHPGARAPRKRQFSWVDIDTGVQVIEVVAQRHKLILSVLAHRS